MRHRKRLIVIVASLSCLVAQAGNKTKNLLPADVVRAESVLVVVDPQAETDPQHPNVNQDARDSVEKALMKWGRYSIAIDAPTADLIITVRKGSGKAVQPVIGGIPQNNRPIVLQPTDSGVRIGGRSGASGTAGDPSDPQSPSKAEPQLQVGQSQDTFAVYRSSSRIDPHDAPLDAPAAWRYVAKNALESPDVPAVEVFRKLVLESEKQLAAKKP